MLTSDEHRRATSIAKAERNSRARERRRRGLTPVSNHADSSAATAKPSALSTTNSRTSCATSGSVNSESAGLVNRGSMSGEPLTQWVAQAVAQA